MSSYPVLSLAATEYPFLYFRKSKHVISTPTPLIGGEERRAQTFPKIQAQVQRGIENPALG